MANFPFSPTDPILGAAQGGRYAEMYDRLNGAPIYDILDMLETLCKQRKLVALDPDGNWYQQLSAIDQAPIFRERMKVAVAAVRLAGQMTSLHFQRDYEAWLALLPTDQRMTVLKFIADRATGSNKDVPNLLSYGPLQPTGWRICTSGGIAASYSYFTGGGGAVYLQHAGNPDEIYRYVYGAVGIGKSASKWSVSFSTKDFPGSGLPGILGQMMRTGSRAADLPSDAFAGLGVMVCGSVAGALIKGCGGTLGVTLLIMGYDGSYITTGDVNQVPTKAAAFGFLYGVANDVMSQGLDAGIAYSLIVAKSPERVKL